GTAPNRILVVEWFVTIPRNTTGAANSTMQAWLYENNGRIEFRYGAMGSGAMSASVGLTATTTNYLSVNIVSGNASIITPTDNNATTPSNGTIYTFAQPTLSYSWSPASFLNSTTISNPEASSVANTTTYTVTVESNGCSTSSPVTLIAGAPLSATASTTTPSACAGNDVTLSANPVGGGGPYTYSWTGPLGFTSGIQNPTLTGATTNMSGIYEVTITDNCGTTATASLNLTVNAAPAINLSSTSGTYCTPAGPAVTLNASGADTYSWSPATGLSATSGSSVDATPSSATSYTVVGTDANTGCLSTATTLINVSASVTMNTVSATESSVCFNGGTILSANASTTLSYCASTHASGCSGDNITNVSLGSINNPTSGCGGASFYTLFTAGPSTTTSLSPSGGTYTLSVSFGTDANQYFGAWIDFNQNGIFEVSEFLGASANAGANGTASITFTVPAGAANGSTRLRIVGGNDLPVLSSQACGASSSPWGETQDYPVTIIDGFDAYTYTWSPSTFLNTTNGPAVTASAMTATTNYIVTATVNGCSATGSVNITVNQPSTGTDVITACDSHTWIDGVTYTASNNTATFTLTNAIGCDSLVTLNLTINNSNTGTDVVTACDSYTWIDGITYTADNSTATFVLTNAAGCDSTVTLNLTLLNNTGTDVVTACETYTWIDGVTYTANNNTATFTLTNAAGCDSVVTLNLTINNSNTGTDVITACDSYTWIDGVTYTANNNTATFILTNVAGCDSLVTLNLTINNSNTGTDVITACDAYTWIDGVTYTASNNSATFTLTNAAGCDSVVTLNLTINNSTTGTDVITACDSYTWIDGVTYTASNNSATFTLTNAI
ncbi:MAG: beta strand repeat-containing protein, partial [Bacteroidota bacterium]